MDGLVLASVTSTPPDGEAVPSATGKFTEEPAATNRFPGTMIAADSGWVTVTPAVALLMPGALAVIVTAPAATAVSATGALLASAGMVMVAGTAATFGLLEFRLTVMGKGAAEDRFNVRF